jgi:AcrR family transcriptional regulator
MNPRPLSLRRKQQQHTQAEIVRVAFDLFGRHGYDKVPVEMIAAAVGISRATFFNYFPQKELILREVAAARVERLKAILAEYAAGGHAPTRDGIVGLILKLCEENARITRHSKTILLETIFRQASQGLMLGARDKAIKALAKVIARAPRRRGVPAELVAETLFAVYIATMLEWLIREGVPDRWLMDTMRKRLRLAWEGAA